MLCSFILFYFKAAFILFLFHCIEINFLYITFFSIKGIVYPPKLSFTHSHVDPNLYDFHSSVKKKNVLVPTSSLCLILYGQKNTIELNMKKEE